MAVLACIGILSAAETECFKAGNWNYSIWGVKPGYSMKKLPKGVEVSITGELGNTPGENNLQMRAIKNGGFDAGRYKIVFQAKCNKDVMIPVNIIFEQPPYWGCHKEEIELKAGKTEKIDIIFELKKHMEKKSLRIPGFALGKLPVGTVLEITDLHVYKIVN